MISYIDPKVDTIPDAQGIDAAIQDMQTKLATLPWLQKVYGRVKQQRRRDANTNRDIIYPEILSTSEPIDLMPNDNLASYCFFNPTDPASFTNGFGDLEVSSVQPVDIILWGNLNKIDPAKNYDFSENLRVEFALKIIQTCPKFLIRQSFSQWDTIFRPFTISDTYRTYLKLPFFGFKISGTLSFSYSIC